MTLIPPMPHSSSVKWGQHICNLQGYNDYISDCEVLRYYGNEILHHSI